MRRTLLAALTLGLLPLLAAPAAAPARAEPVDLALVLAADVSISVDNDEFRLQREGYAAALTDPRVLQAIAAGPHGVIAVSFVEWSGARAQRVVVDWSVLRDGETAAVFAAALRRVPRSFADVTAIGNAIDFAMRHFAGSGASAAPRIIDVSGDGDNNAGRPVEYARNDAVAQGVTINGLAIVNEHPAPGFIGHVQPPGGIGAYYRTRVIGGPGAFALEIGKFDDFAQAMTEKLLHEIAAARGVGDVARR